MYQGSFEPVEIDHAPGVRHFTVAVSLADVGGLERLEVSGQGRSAVQVPPAGTEDLSVVAERTGAGSVTIRWNRSAAPLLIVRDPATGRVVAMGTSGAMTIPASASEFELIRPGVRPGVASRIRF